MRLAAAGERAVREIATLSIPLVEYGLVAAVGVLVALIVGGQFSVYFSSLGTYFPY